MEEFIKKLFAPKPTSNMSGFQFSDLLNNDRWRTAQRDSYSPKRGELAVKNDPFSGVNYREYVPRANVTEKVTTDNDGKKTSVVTTAYEAPGETYGFPLNNRQFRPDDGMGANSSYSSRGPVTTSGNPFGYPQHATIKGPPRYTDVYQEMPGAQYSMRYTGDEDGPGQRSIPQSYGPAGQIANRMQPSGYRRPVQQTSPEVNVGAITRYQPAPQSTLDRFPFLGMDAMSDEDRMRMLELLLIGRDD
jgi:hypothetical protein